MLDLLNDIDRLREIDNAHHLHPFTDHQSLAARRAASSSAAEGVYVWDTDGKQDHRRHVGPVVRECRLWPDRR